MQNARIACVRYLNTSPLVEGLEKTAGITLIPSVPAHIVGMLERGEADIGLASVVDSVMASKPMSLLPVGMIGCDGPTLTVRLFSAVPLNKVTKLHVDTDSHTSVILARVLLKKLHGIVPEIVQFDARERVEQSGGSSSADGWPESLLLIGDKVVTDGPPAVRFPHQLDLGEAWKSLTGLPFVYACWMCPTERLADPASGETIRTAAAILDRQLRHNLTRIDWLVATRAPNARWPADLARRYIGELLRYHVGDRERSAVETFLGMAREIGALGKNGCSLVWAW